MQTILNASKTVKFLICYSIIVLAASSLYRLPYSPATWFDEGINLGIAKSLITKGTYSLEVAPGEFVVERPFLITTNYPIILPVALSLKIFGINLTAARIPMVIFMWLFALFAFLLAKRLGTLESAALTLALIVTFVPFYGNGKNVLGEIPGLTYFLAGLLLLTPNSSLKKLFSAGLLFGLSAASKPFFLIILGAIALGEIYFYKNNSRPKARALALIFGAMGPLMLWLWTIMPKFSAAGLAETFGFYANSYAANNFLSAIFENSLRFITESTPFHFLILFVAVAYFLSKKIIRKETLHETELILLAFIVIDTLWYLKTPGWYRYFFPAHIFLFLIFPEAVKSLLNKKIAVVILAALIVMQTGLLISKRHDSFYNSDDAVRTSAYLNSTQKTDESMLAINTPSIAFLNTNPNTYQYLQINPTLFFGKNSLLDKNNKLFNYIVLTSGEGANITHLKANLESKYSPVSFGSYKIYELKK